MKLPEILERLKEAIDEEDWLEVQSLIDDIEREMYLFPDETQRKKAQAA